MDSIFKEFEDKTVLVTGATGLIGVRIVSLLLDNTNACNVIAIGRSETKLNEIFFPYAAETRLTLITHDISSNLNLKEDTIDFLLHAGGPQERDVIINQPLDVITANISGLMNCMNYLYDQVGRTGHHGRLIVFSSLTVYGNALSDVVQLVNETDTNRAGHLDDAMTVYSESKRMAEVLAASYHRTFNIDYVTCRLSTVYGPSKSPTKTAFFEFIKKAKNGEKIIVQEKYGLRRDNIFLDDAVIGIFFAALRGKTGNAYNVSSNGELANFLSVAEIAQHVAKVANKALHNKDIVKVEFKDNTKKSNAGLLLNNEKLKGLGWKLSHTFTEGLQKSFD